MKRGSSGLSLLVGVKKPVGMTSHDVVNRCRRLFGERRVGHTGTLDPMASGVLPICVGPATRLDPYLTGHDKRYRVGIGFGCETTTDDAEGEPTVSAPVPELLFDESYARPFVASLVGTHQQLPPLYSAIKVNGVKAYEAARKGTALDLDFREITISQAELVRVERGKLGGPRKSGALGGPGELRWIADFTVSKGTYLRSLARDIGRMVGCPAHVESLERLSSGLITLEECVSLETLEVLGIDAALDPVAALGLRYAFADDVERFVCAGNRLHADQLKLNEPLAERAMRDRCACMGQTCPSADAPRPGELIALVVKNRLKALYSFDGEGRCWKPACVFSTSIYRG